MNTLPTCIKARRFGHHSMGSENEYDAFGEQAPITWVCNCGARLSLEVFDHDMEEYVEVPQQRKDAFKANHTTCVTPVCHVCETTPVHRAGAWCDECVELDEQTAPQQDDYLPF